MTAPGRVVVDARATQSPAHADRGIARYVTEQVAAMERVAPGRVTDYLLHPGFTVASSAEAIAATGRARWEAPLDGVAVLHVTSPFEDHLSAAQLWPHELRRGRARLVVTVYDVIPLLFPDEYLSEFRRRARYLGRARLISCADVVLTISERTRTDVIEHLGIHERRVRTVGAGVSDIFAPAEGPREDAVGGLWRHVRGIRPGYVLYTGGVDPRKNMERLIRAYGLLTEDVRAMHQLVITCHVGAEDAERLRRIAGESGVAGSDLLLTGHVPDEVLARLYQAAALVVFPSLYEGFGLPAAEALRCGATVIASDTSSLPEIVRDSRARFDPFDDRAIAAAMHRALTDGALGESLQREAAAAAGRFTWDRVASATLRVYDELADGGQRAGRGASRRARLAVVSPYPPTLSGVADYTARLADALAVHVDVDCFVDGDPSNHAAPGHPSCRLLPARALELQRALAHYDRVLYCLGNSAFHHFALDLLRRVPGDVLAHDACIAGLYWAVCVEEGTSFPELVRRIYGPRRPPGSRAGELPTTPLDARRAGYWMLHEVLAHARRVFVHSRLALEIVRLEGALAGWRGAAGVLPFAYPDPSPDGPEAGWRRDGGPIVGSFGLVSSIKRPEAVLEAFARIARRDGSARLAFVGPVERPLLRRLAGLANRMGVLDRLVMTGAVEIQEYRRWLRCVDVAVQLRETSQGEASAAVAEAQAHGVPTVVTGLGWMGDLPDATVRKVSPRARPQEIAHAVEELLDDAGARRRMGLAAREHAARHSFRALAAPIASALLDDRVPEPGALVAAAAT